MSKMFKGRTN